MRTTIDLPADLHAVAREMAHQQHKSLGQVVAELVRLGLSPAGMETADVPASGLPTIRVGRPITAEDVRSLEDE
ncbi:antitoxin [Candidatus Poriferisodalis sp.]|uniref:antitoxin n=1 Tax=Candidatus Poriferisodalis sp. TaxID=3101277 RepID=UPI003B02E7A9